MRSCTPRITTAFLLLLAPTLAAAYCDGGGSASPGSTGAGATIINVPAEDDRHALCSPQPQPACAAAASAHFVIKNNPGDEKDLLMWRWSKGDAVDDLAMGDPSTNTRYAVCVYDSFQNAKFLIASLAVDAGRGWKHSGTNAWRYLDDRGTSANVRVHVESGPKNRTKARIKAFGYPVSLPTPASRLQFFHEDRSVVVQLVSSSNATCWTSTFTTARKNSPASFVAP